MDVEIQSLCQRVRAARGKVPLKEFARQTGVHFNTLLNYEGGRMPPISFLYRVIEVAKCDREWLLFGAKSSTGRTPHEVLSDLPLLMEMVDLVAEEAPRKASRLSDEQAEIVSAAYLSLMSSAERLQATPDRNDLASYVEAARKLARHRRPPAAHVDPSSAMGRAR